MNYPTDLPSSAMGVMRQLSVSKTGIERFSNQLIQSVKNGEVNPLELKACFKAMEKIIEIVDAATKVNQISEAERYSEQKFSAFGCEIEKAELGTKYDYLTCGDPIYEHRHALLESAKGQLEERAQFLKALREPLTIVDDESGQVATIHPPVKKSTTGLKFSIK